jgi:hypothetical protein
VGNNNLFCKMVLDMFSGQENPFVIIPQMDFILLLNEVYHFEKQDANLFFDGLGFRGIKLQNGANNLIVQKDIIKIDIHAESKYMKCSKKFFDRTLELFDKYDLDKKYDIFSNSKYLEILGN